MNWEPFTAIFIGIGLSAACGFRVFLPLLILSIASMTGQMKLGAGFEWIGSTPALIAFLVASGLEIAAYYVPVVDHILDLISGPVAVAAGTLISGSLMFETTPLLKWSMAIIAGGGVAGLVKGGSATVRATSLLTTGGLGNFVVSTLENIASVAIAILAMLLPILIGLLILMILIPVAIGLLVKKYRKKAAAPAA